MKSGRQHELDVIRGLAIVAVVVYHAIVAVDVLVATPPRWIITLNEAASPFRMPVLMFLSGLLLPRSIRKPRGEYVAGKLRLIAWPYVVWTSLIVAFYVVGARRSGEGLTRERLLEILTDPATFTWYLAYLFVYYLLSLAVPQGVRTWSVPVLIASSGFVEDAWIERFVFLLGMFWAGEWFARHPDIRSRLAHPVALGLGGIAALVAMWASTTGGAARYDPLTSLGVAGLLTVALPLATRLAPTGPGRWCAAVGRDSIVYYVTHWIPVAVAAQALALIGMQNSVLAVIAAASAGLVVSAVAVALRRRSATVRFLYAWPRATPEPVA